MTYKYLRTEIGNGIHYTEIIDPKFTTFRIGIKFLTKLSLTTASANAAALATLTSSNANLPTLADMASHLNSLYGADVSSNVYKKGDIQVLSIGSCAIANRFALGGEDICGELVTLLLDCLFNPNIINGEFESSVFDFRKKDLLDSIEAEINNKRGFAIMKACETVYEGEPCAVSASGTLAFATAVTAGTAYEAYCNLLKSAGIEITFVGSEPEPNVKEKFASAFAKIARSPIEIKFKSYSPAKTEVKKVTLPLDVQQSKMVLAFKPKNNSEINDRSFKFMSTIFGETPSSKLFMNVREKLSLCYYCASGFSDAKHVLLVDSGIDTQNLELAKTEILRQLEAVANGEISQAEYNNALLTIKNSLGGVGDTTSGLDGYYFGRLFTDSTGSSPEDEVKMLEEITVDDIAAVAKSLVLDTEFVLLQKK